MMRTMFFPCSQALGRVAAMALVLGSCVVAPGSELTDSPGNDSFATATPIALNEATEEKITDDVDFYVLDVPMAGVIEVSLDPVPASIDLRAVVYDTDQYELVAYTAGSAGRRLAFPLLVDTGRYYIRVARDRGETSSAEPYTLTVRFDGTDTREINNTFAQAAPIAFDEEVVATIRSFGDVDYYVFETTRDGVIRVSLDPVPADIEIEATVYDDNQNRLTGYSSGTEGRSLWFPVLSAAGRHYLLVEPDWVSSDSYSSPESYTLTVRFDDTDGYELNNNFAQAAAITLDDVVVGTIGAPGDEDYFFFDVSDEGTLHVTIEPVPADIELVVYLYDDFQNYIFSNFSGDVGRPMDFVIPLAPGMHYMRIYDDNYASSPEPYELRMRLEPIAGPSATVTH